MIVLLIAIAMLFQQQFTAQDTLNALEYASPLAQCIVGYETGWTYYPYSIGAEGELGVAQLHPKGMLPVFYAMGYTNPFDPEQAIEFLEIQIIAGNAYHWTPVLWGLCADVSIHSDRTVWSYSRVLRRYRGVYFIRIGYEKSR